MRSPRSLLVVLASVSFVACRPSPARGPAPAVVSDAPRGAEAEAALADVARVHGGHGPWAVAGFRMGRFAMTELALPKHSFDLEVVHKSPRSVQWSCVADGAAAATGASAGKLNLTLVEIADPAATVTIYARKSTGEKLAMRPTRAFVERFRDVPREKLAEAGREAMALRDVEIFEIIDPDDATGAKGGRKARATPAIGAH